MARPHRRHLVRLLVLAAVGFAVIRLRKVLMGTTADRRDPQQGPVIGSVDTWAPVPRAPEKAGENGS